MWGASRFLRVIGSIILLLPAVLSASARVDAQAVRSAAVSLTEQNREIALSFVRQMPGGTFDEAMFRDDFTFWTAFSEMNKEKFFQVCDSNKLLFKPGFTIHMLNSIAEGNFVAVEAVSDGQYLNGTDYKNNYLLVFDIRDGKIAKIREYMDTKLVADTMLPALQQRFNINVATSEAQ